MDMQQKTHTFAVLWQLHHGKIDRQQGGIVIGIT